MNRNPINVARNLDLCGDTIVQKVGLPTSASEYMREGAEAIRLLMKENARLATENEKISGDNDRFRTALGNIARGYPCSTVRDMRRVAADAIGKPINLPSRDEE